MPIFVIEDHILEWHTCQICSPLETSKVISPFSGLRSERDKSVYFGYGVVIYFIMQSLI